jgi:hypothetical protein
MTSPVVQIYDMSDGEAQETLLDLLQEVDGIAARPAFSGPDRYLVIECDDATRAHSIFTMVTSVDPDATLIHSTNGSAPQFDDRPLELELD